MRAVTLIGRLSPLISLASGLVTLFLLRRGVDFAPISAGLALAAWIFAIVFSRRFSPFPGEDGPPISKVGETVRFASQAVVVGLYQNVLFFLLPIWFGSATVLSANIVFPAMLGGIALFSCFDATFAKHVVAHALRRSIVSAVVLFAVSVPALCLVTHLPVRVSIAVCAGGTAFAAAILGTSGRRLHKNVLIGALTAVAAAPLFYFAAIFLPPAPVQCVDAVAASRIEKRIPVAVSASFKKGTPKVFAHFSVAAPDHFTQDIHFQWFVDGTALGHPIASKIVGGRKQGFRTWTYRSNPARGAYRVDLITKDKQLIGRVFFRVK